MQTQKLSTEQSDALKVKTQTYIVTGSVLLMVGKFIAYFVTLSVGIFTDAMESIVNVAAGFISLYSLRFAIRPKDKNHPYGHGRIEFISASIEGILIIIAGIIIIFEGLGRLFHPQDIQKLDIGIWIVAIAGLINFFMGQYSVYLGKKYNSMALTASGEHLKSDTYSSIGLVAGLILLYFTKIAWIDSALALIFGSIILYTGFSIFKRTSESLMDKADPKVLQALTDCIAQKRQIDWIDVHNLKVSKHGSAYFIDCDLTLPWYYSVQQGHGACETLKNVIREGFSENVGISIHSDPCKCNQCSYCHILDCPHREHPFEKHKEITISELTESDE